MADLDTSVPAWLQRNWAPRETFDPTPWLQERYRRQVEQQKLPLQLQQMSLANEATRLGIEHQGMVNEMQGMQLQQYKEELPRFQQILSETGGNPTQIMDRVESFKNPALQQQWLNLRQSAAQTTLATAHREQIIDDIKKAADLTARGFGPVALNPDGTVNREDLGRISNLVREHDDKLDQLKYGWHTSTDTTPVLEEHGGVQFLRNPKTGHLERLTDRPSAALLEAKDYAALKQRLDAANNRLMESGIGEETPEIRATKNEIQQLQAAIDNMESRHGMEELKVQTPEGMVTTLTRGKQKSPETLTTTEQSRLGEDIQATSNSLRSLSQLRSQLNSNVVGAMPTIANLVFDKILAQVDPTFESEERVKGRRMINITTQQVLGELNRSGRFSNLELKRLEAILPSSGAFGSPAEAKDAVDQLKRVLAEKGAKAAQSMKRAVSPEILSSLADMEDTDLASDVRNGFLDRDIAIQAREFRKKRAK